jgi:adenylate kinase family enzyme
MIQALDLEIAAVRKKGGFTRIELRNGEHIGQADGWWLYRFTVIEELNLPDDTPVRITCGQEDVAGVLVSFREGVLIVGVEKDLGPKIAVATLIADESFLLERLKERLEKIRRGELQFQRQFAERVLGLSPPTSGDAEPSPIILSDGALNLDQIAAVRRSLGSNVVYVWGPPGTGKTTTLARIVEAHYRAGRSVLLVSNTNIAVDTALEKVAERLKDEPEFQHGLVVRQGPVVKEELRRRFGPQVILEEIIARLGEQLQSEKTKLLQEARRLDKVEQSCVAALKAFERLATLQKSLAAQQSTWEDLKRRIAQHEAEAREHRSRQEKLLAEIKRIQSSNIVLRYLLGMKVKRLERQVEAAQRAAESAMQVAQTLIAKQDKLDAAVTELRRQVTQLTKVTQNYPPPAEIESRLAKVRTRKAAIEGRIRAIDGQLSDLEQQVLARCKILATTVYRTYLGRGGSRHFDVVVIDEASMLMLPLVYYGAGLALVSVTVAGDFRQLPPIVLSEEPLALEWLKCDVFKKAGIPEQVARCQSIPHLVVLGTQYRMCKSICDVVNMLFYDDHPLDSDPSVMQNNESFPLAEEPLLFINTASYNPWTALRVGTFSRYNIFHALLVRNIILHLAEQGFLPPQGEPNEAVGAVTPYAAQARLIQSLLSERLGDRAAGVAATVHRFQGNEKKVIVLDLTDSVGTPLSRFLKATSIDEDGARLLNVATSRARKHVILLGNFHYLMMKAPKGAYVRRLVDHFMAHGTPLDVAALLPLSETDWIDALKCVLPSHFQLPENASGLFDENNFYPAFLSDLVRARESVVIFTPFMTQAGTTRWIDVLCAAIARGVRVRVLTRPPDTSGDRATAEVRELIQRLRALGIVVDLRARMHEKIAIIDGCILWHGSLNIFSHRDTHESMLRIVSRAACSQLARLVSTPGGRFGDRVSLDAPENPECPRCGGPTVWNDGRYGIYFECEQPSCGGKLDARGGRRSSSTAGPQR